MTQFEKIKRTISDAELTRDNAFDTLREIAVLCNNKKSVDNGRELLIRALDKRAKFQGFEQILNSLCRSVGLYPYMTDIPSDGRYFSDLLDYEFHRPFDFRKDLVFHELQLKIYSSLLNGNNVVLSGPTSVGKSLIIDALVASSRFKTVLLVVPTIALMDETRQRIATTFTNCKIITHQSQIRSSNSDIINVYILTQERVLERNDIEDIDLFVIDEFYQLDPKNDVEDSRAITLNLALYKLLKVSKQFYLIGPNIDNVSGLRELGKEYIFYPSAFTTVAVDIFNYNFSKDNPAKHEKLISLYDDLTGPMLIYCQSPTSATAVANILVTHSKKQNDLDLSDALDWINKEYHPDWIFAKALKYGIGIHHGGIPRALQQFVIRLFNEKKIRVIICTATIIEGVNTVAKNVVIYDRRKSTKLLTYFTYKNIEGRAGRMGQYFVGTVHSLEEAPEKVSNEVNIPVGTQNEKLPVDMLLQLDKEDLLPSSIVRINQSLQNSQLSRKTIENNFPYSIESQNLLAQELLNNITFYKNVLSWRNLPTTSQLDVCCNLIFEFLETSSLRQNSISSGDQLAFYVKAFRNAQSYSDFIKQQINEVQNDHSAILDTILKIVRNVFCFSFPRAMRALDFIQKEIIAKNGYETGDFSLFCSQIENLYLDSTVFALDEFGIPLQTAAKLQRYLPERGTLDTILQKIKDLNLNRTNLSSFEKDIVQTVRKSF